MGGNCPDISDEKNIHKMIKCQDQLLLCSDRINELNANFKDGLDNYATKLKNQITGGKSEVVDIDDDKYIFDSFLNSQVERYVNDMSENFVKIYNRLNQKIEVIKLQEDFVNNTCDLTNYYIDNTGVNKDKFEKIQSKINMNNRMTEYYDEKVENINTWTYYGKYIYWLVITILTAILCYVSYKAGYITALINFIKKKLGLDKVKDEIEKNKLLLPSNQSGGTKKEIEKKIKKEEKEEKIFNFLFKRVREARVREADKEADANQYNLEKDIPCYKRKDTKREDNFFTKKESIYPVIKYNKILDKNVPLFDSSNSWLKHKNIYKNIQKCDNKEIPEIKAFNIIPKGIKRLGEKAYRNLEKKSDDKGIINIDEFSSNRQLYEALKNLKLPFLQKLSYYYKFMKKYNKITDEKLKTKHIYDILSEKNDDIKEYYQKYKKNLLFRELKNNVSKDEKEISQFLKRKRNTINNKLDSRYMGIYGTEKEKYIKEPKYHTLFNDKEDFFDFALSSANSGKYIKLGRALGDWDKIKDKYEMTSKRGVYKLKNGFKKDKPQYGEEIKNSYGKKNSVVVIDKNNIKNNQKDIKMGIDMKQQGKDMNQANVMSASKIPKTPKFYIILLLLMLITPVIAVPFLGPIIRFLKPYLFPYT